MATNSWSSIRILIVLKPNSFFNLINQQADIDKIYFYAKDPCEAKNQFLIKKREDVGTKYLIYCKAFIEYSMIWIIFIKKWRM